MIQMKKKRDHHIRNQIGGLSETKTKKPKKKKKKPKIKKKGERKL